MPPCGVTVAAGELRDGEESPPAWAALVVVDPPLADPHDFKRIVICDTCKASLQNGWMNQREPNERQ